MTEPGGVPLDVVAVLVTGLIVMASVTTGIGVVVPRRSSFLDAFRAGIQMELVTSPDAPPVPYYLGRVSSFPYVEGTAFLRRARSVDAGVVRDLFASPPDTTVQLLRTLGWRDEPAVTDLADPQVPPDWEPVLARRFGAAELLALLEAPDGRGGGPGPAPCGPLLAWYRSLLGPGRITFRPEASCGSPERTRTGPLRCAAATPRSGPAWRRTARTRCR